MIGRTVSHYQVLAHLGSGGMGDVYRARDLRLDRTVVLKFLPPARADEAGARERFHREARAASGLDHASICTIYDIDETEDGQQFICMAYCDGESLADRLIDGPLPPGEAARIALRVAEGLVCAHGHGVVHRDLKPSNIQLTTAGEVKILDFGVARLAGQERLTTDGSALGTLPYMSPEQLGGEEVDDRSDLWALGVLLFEMLTGRRPFRGESISELVQAIASEPTPDPEAAELRVPEELADVVRWCLEKDVADRPESAAQLADALRGLVRASSDDPTILLTPLPRTVRRRRKRRRRILIGLLAAIVLLGLAGLQAAGVLPPWRSERSSGVALLPLTVIGGDEADRRLGAGLVQHLIAELSLEEPYQDGRWIVPLSIVRNHEVHSTDTARGKLGVGEAVGGTLHVQGDLLRLELLLHDTGARGWKGLSLPPARRTVAGSRDDLVAWTDDVRAALLDLMGWRAPPGGRQPATAGRTHSSAALALYLQGLGQQSSVGDLPADRAAAWRSFQKVLAIDSSFQLARVRLAALQWRGIAGEVEPDPDAALAVCEQVLTREPDLFEAHFLRAMILRDRGSPEAIDAFRRCLALTPMHWPSIAQLGECFVAADEPDSAEAYLRRVAQARPDFVSVHTELGWLYWYYDRPEEARAEFREVVRLAPDEAGGIANLGSVAYSLERWDEAEAMYLRALALAPRADIYTNLGTIYFYQHRFRDATQMFEAAMEMEPDEPSACGMAAECYWFGGEDRQHAIELFARAAALADSILTIRPADLGMKASLALYLVRLGDESRAESLLDAVDDADPGNPFVHYVLAIAFEDLGERERAVRHVAIAMRGGYSRWDIERYPGFDRLRQSPGYLALLDGRGAEGAATAADP